MESFPVTGGTKVHACLIFRTTAYKACSVYTRVTPCQVSHPDALWGTEKTIASCADPSEINPHTFQHHAGRHAEYLECVLSRMSKVRWDSHIPDIALDDILPVWRDCSDEDLLTRKNLDSAQSFHGDGLYLLDLLFVELDAE